MSLSLATRGFLGSGGGTNHLVDVASLVVTGPNTLELRFDPPGVSPTDFGKLRTSYTVTGEQMMLVEGIYFNTLTRALYLTTSEQVTGASYSLRLLVGVVMTPDGVVNRAYTGSFIGQGTPASIPEAPPTPGIITRWQITNVGTSRVDLNTMKVFSIIAGGSYTTYNLAQADRLGRFVRAGNLVETRYADHATFVNRTAGVVSLQSLNFYLEPGDSIVAPVPAEPLALEALQAAGWVTITRS